MLKEKKDSVHDQVKLEDEGDPTSQDDEDGVPDDNNNKNHTKVRLRVIPHNIMMRDYPLSLNLKKNSKHRKKHRVFYILVLNWKQ